MAQAAHRPLAHAPSLTRVTDPIFRGLLSLGVPMGPNVLITIRGRVSGTPRTQPLAIVEADGRRWVMGTFGDVNWCRNLRANPDVEVRHGRRRESLRAVELQPDEARHFFTQTLPRSIAQMPLPVRVFGALFIRATAPDMNSDPEGAADRHPVFELVADAPPSADGPAPA
jgi:deazaflavin-dependent oxidoreductase (nitroreductase family)